MGFGELFLLAIGVSMDAFAVSICKGLAVKKARLREMGTCGLWFGGFQALMTLIGFLLATFFAGAIQALAPCLAFVMLTFLGINMLKESFSKEECECCNDQSADFGIKTMFVMAIATSIDALAVGVSIALVGVSLYISDPINIWLAISLIGITTCLFSAIGVKIGNVFGARFEKKAEVAGGVILILLGLKILLEHLGVIG